ncbi:CHASE4 domain-containing protein [Methanolobus sp. WCC4]|uniref:CHASE4 domain-containing protein n=1 Tax=Methanolobus sp. WCC4 TaxID=3125784 RepID=UPI0030F51866
MKIYNKTVVTLGIVFMFLFLLTASVTHYVFMTHTQQIENEVLEDNSLRVQRAFSNEIDHVDKSTYDWAAWDDTYEFVQNGNSEYIYSNLDSIETLLILDVNFILFYDNDGNLVYGRACDLTEEEEIPLPVSLLEEFDGNNIMLEQTSVSSSSSGIVVLADLPTIVVSRPIIQSNYEGPIAGTLIMGRFIDRSFVESIEEQTLLPIDIHYINDPGLPSDFGSIKEQALKENHVTLISNNGNTISAYFIIEDIYGETSLISRTELPRTIYKQGLATISTTFYLTLFISLTFALLLLLILKKDLLSRITSLRNGIRDIDLKADIKSRLDINGEDELTDLADSINSMLDSLQRTGSIFQSTIESISYGLVAVTKEQKIIFMNPAYRKMFEIPPEMDFGNDAQELLSYIIQKARDPEEIADRKDERRYTLDVKNSVAELRDGRTIETISLPLIVNNEIHGRLYVHNDITDILSHENELRDEIDKRKKAEERLKLSEEKFSKIATYANDAIIMINDEGRTTFWNNAATSMFGYSEEEVKGERIHEFISPEKYLDLYKTGFRKFTETGTGPVLGKTIDLEGKKKDGTEFPIELSLSSMQLSDGSWSAVSIVRDVTERKRLDDMEHELLERLLTIINNINTGIMLIDSKSKTIVDVNPVAAEMIGLPKEKIVGNICHRFVCLAEEGHCPIIDLNQTVDHSERILLDKDGKEIPVVKSVVTVKLKGKEYLIESFYDISDRKKVEEALIDAKLAAEASNRAKSEFLTNMSHELRTPLNSIIGFSDMLLHNGTNTSSDKQQKYLSNISNSGKHLLEVINDILDLSKIEAGKGELDIEEFSIQDVMDEVKRTLMPLASKKDISFEYTVDDDIDIIEADRLKIKQILYNLAGNAIKFTLDNGSIRIFVRRTLNNVEVDVKDSGIGIHPDDLIDLFQPFRQVDSALNRNYEGSGLGLAIVKKYVEMHGGSIRVESEPDKGSSFIFEIPLHQ